MSTTGESPGPELRERELREPELREPELRQPERRERELRQPELPGTEPREPEPADSEPADPEEKRVTWAELYFDLVFVFAITQVSGLLHHHHDAVGLVRALVVFVPVYWCWVGTTVQANIRDVDNLRDRLGILLVGLTGLFMALAIPGAYGGRGVLLGAAYWLARLVLLLLLARVPGVWRGPYGVGVLVSGPLLVTGGLLPDGPRLALWTAAALCDLAAPLVFRRRLAKVAYHPAHMPERFALFLLVALGESIVGIGGTAASARLDAAELAAVAVAFTISAGLWWQYFVYAADAMRHAVVIADSRRDVVRRIFQYGHLALVAGVIGVAVGFGETVADPWQALGPGSVTLLYGGCGLYLLTFGYTRWMMFRQVATTRIGAAVVVLALLPAMVRLPALVVLATLAVLMVVLNVLEHFRVERSARSAVGNPAAAGEGAPAAGPAEADARVPGPGPGPGPGPVPVPAAAPDPASVPVPASTPVPGPAPAPAE